MAIKRSIGVQKRRRETPPKGSAWSVLPTLKESAVSAELSEAFDPRPYLSKLATGKTSREYKSDEPIFSQEEKADAIFYVDSGKVRLTVVSALYILAAQPRAALQALDEAVQSATPAMLKGH